MILFHLTPQYKEIQKERVFGVTQWHRPATLLFGTSPISRDESLMQTLLILQDLAKKINLGLLCTVYVEKGKEKGDVGKDAKWRELLLLLPTQGKSLGLLLSGHLGNNLIASLICDSLFLSCHFICCCCCGTTRSFSFGFLFQIFLSRYRQLPHSRFLVRISI